MVSGWYGTRLKKDEVRNIDRKNLTKERQLLIIDIRNNRELFKNEKENYFVSIPYLSIYFKVPSA
jgi:hypothetical protein